jgi:hypothetical protein
MGLLRSQSGCCGEKKNSCSPFPACRAHSIVTILSYPLPPSEDKMIQINFKSRRTSHSLFKQVSCTHKNICPLCLQSVISSPTFMGSRLIQQPLKDYIYPELHLKSFHITQQIHAVSVIKTNQLKLYILTYSMQQSPS